MVQGAGHLLPDGRTIRDTASLEEARIQKRRNTTSLTVIIRGLAQYADY
jgi:hypothetical protein